MDQLRGLPQSPNFNPLDFFLWGYLKNKVYSSIINNLEELQNRICNACEIIRQRYGIFERVCNFVRGKCQECMEMEGRTCRTVSVNRKASSTLIIIITYKNGYIPDTVDISTYDY